MTNFKGNYVTRDDVKDCQKLLVGNRTATLEPACFRLLGLR